MPSTEKKKKGEELKKNKKMEKKNGIKKIK